MEYTEEQDLPRVNLREVVDLCLKFPDEATANAVLMDGEAPRYRTVDVIGVIWKPTGEVLQGEDGEYPSMEAVEGWHVNIRLHPDEDLADLEPYLVNPEPVTPVRVWA